jgi:predicted enzyme related to lactoylglutathione lyase
MQLRIVVDVPELEAGIAFYTRGLELTVGRRKDSAWAELLGGPCPIDLVAKEEWSGPFPTANRRRSFSRHWTPVHLDVVVDALEPAVQRLTEAGAALDRPIQERPWGRMANLGDPFGHGLCVIEFRGKGYDEVLEG